MHGPARGAHGAGSPPLWLARAAGEERPARRGIAAPGWGSVATALQQPRCRNPWSDVVFGLRIVANTCTIYHMSSVVDLADEMVLTPTEFAAAMREHEQQAAALALSLRRLETLVSGPPTVQYPSAPGSATTAA